MTFEERDTLTAEEAQQRRALKGKSRMHIDNVYAEIKEREVQDNENN